MTDPAKPYAVAGSVPAGPTLSRPFGILLEWLCRWAFASIRIAPDAVDRIRSLAARGSVVYIMRQRSLVDYVLVTYVLRREGLPSPRFVNDIAPGWWRPLRVVATGVSRRWRRGQMASRELRAFEEREQCQRLVSAGHPVLIFMRGRRPRISLLARHRRSLTDVRIGRDYLREIVHRLWASEQEVSVVPIAVLRGRGMRRKESRLATLVYSVQEMPGELRRLISLLWNLRETSINAGGEVPLQEFTRQYQREGEERILRRLTRALQIFLYREERQVWGPLLLPKRQVRQRVLQSNEMRGVIQRLASERQQAESHLWRQAERYFNEMAANFHGIYFSVVEFVFHRLWPRLFHGLEYVGLERVSECVRRHPIVLVPCHRSHFDYGFLSYIFHINYLSPPHIAAGINLSFWPLGPLFRGAGAYFIRRRFEGNALYKAVFRQYLTFLIREGYTQEFFIEGGRSRTGKILTPKLGMLSAIVDAFIRGVRRDLYLVPVSIQYERVVEEEAYQRELGGAEKQPESFTTLLRARRLLRRRHGTVYLTFAEPISLNQVLGPRKEEVRRVSDSTREESRRRIVQKLGFRLLREVNNASVAGATSVSATVLLSSPHRACRYRDFVASALALVRFLRSRQVRLTPSLERNLDIEFRDNLAFLEDGGLIQWLPSEGGDVLHVPPEKRRAVDFYKNNTIHFFLIPALTSVALARGRRDMALTEDVSWWLELFRWEFPLPEREEVAAELGRLQEYLRGERALVTANGGERLVTDHPFVSSVIGALDNFRESYWLAAQLLMTLPADGLAQRAVIEHMQKQYQTALLLEEVRKLEGGSLVTFGNALNRFAELKCVNLRPGKGKEQVVDRGENFTELAAIADRIGRSLTSIASAENSPADPPRAHQ